MSIAGTCTCSPTRHDLNFKDKSVAEVLLIRCLQQQQKNLQQQGIALSSKIKHFEERRGQTVLF